MKLKYPRSSRGIPARLPFGRGRSNGGRGRFKLWPILAFAAFAAFYYFSNLETVPITGRKQFVNLSLEQEAALGLNSYKQILDQSNVIPTGSQANQIKVIGNKLASVIDQKDFEWEFNLIDSEQVNAFCLPGGKVAVYTGILPVAKNIDGLAVIMGHEIAHAVARHGAERMASQQLQKWGSMALGMSVGEMDPGIQRGVMTAFGMGSKFGLVLPFSRKHESEADRMGLHYVARACFNPEEAPLLWQRMGEAQNSEVSEFMSTHPNPETRIEQFKEWMPEALRIRAAHCPNS